MYYQLITTYSTGHFQLPPFTRYKVKSGIKVLHARREGSFHKWCSEIADYYSLLWFMFHLLLIITLRLKSWIYLNWKIWWKFNFLKASSDQFSRQKIIKKSAFFHSNCAWYAAWIWYPYPFKSIFHQVFMIHQGKENLLMDKSVRKKLRHFDSHLHKISKGS